MRPATAKLATSGPHGDPSFELGTPRVILSLNVNLRIIPVRQPSTEVARGDDVA
jgi:hypothetical protein